MISEPYHSPLGINYTFEHPQKISKPRTFWDFKNVDYVPNKYTFPLWVSPEL